MKIHRLLPVVPAVLLLSLARAQDAPAPPPATPSAEAPASSSETPPAPMLTNGALADADRDDVPDGWTIFPPADGKATRVTIPGTVRITDRSREMGVGISQWVPAKAGTRYRISAQFQGTGDIYVYLVFARERPANEGELQRHVIREESAGVSNPDKLTRRTLEATAPEGTTYMRAWVYTGRAALADMRVRDVQLEVATPVVYKNETVPFVNPTFADGDGDGLPDGWESTPARSGRIAVTASRQGGVRLRDASDSMSAGVAQVAPAGPGRRYQCTVDAVGQSVVFVRMQYLSAREVGGKSQPDRVLGEVPVVIPAGGGQSRMMIGPPQPSPEGTAFLRLEISTPRQGGADVVVNSVRVTGMYRL